MIHLHTKLNIESVPDNTATLPSLRGYGMQLASMYYYLYSTIGIFRTHPVVLNQTQQQTQLQHGVIIW